MRVAWPNVTVAISKRAALNRFADIKLFSHVPRPSVGKNDRYALSRADIIAVRPVFHPYFYPRLEITLHSSKPVQFPDNLMISPVDRPSCN